MEVYRYPFMRGHEIAFKSFFWRKGGIEPSLTSLIRSKCHLGTLSPLSASFWQGPTFQEEGSSRSRLVFFLSHGN